MSRAKRYSSAEFAKIVEAAARKILSSLDVASVVGHPGEAGGLREQGLRDFLTQLLPRGYHVSKGFAFDARGSQSKQLDIMISTESPLIGTTSDGEFAMLPCEYLLAAVEVKTRLRSTDVRDALANGNSIRHLKPFGKHRFVNARSGGAGTASKEHRVFYSVIAYDTDLVDDDDVDSGDWMRREWRRVVNIAASEDVDPAVLDRVCVLERGGVINGARSKGRIEEGGMTAATGRWFVHLLNHLERERRRRPVAEMDIYTSMEVWSDLRV